MGLPSCYVCGKKADRSKNIVLHTFPKASADVIRFKRWLHALDLNEKDEVRTLVVCSQHFVTTDYCNPLTRQRLKRCTVPSVGVPNPLPCPNDEPNDPLEIQPLDIDPLDIDPLQTDEEMTVEVSPWKWHDDPDQEMVPGRAYFFHDDFFQRSPPTVQTEDRPNEENLTVTPTSHPDVSEITPSDLFTPRHAIRILRRVQEESSKGKSVTHSAKRVKLERKRLPSKRCRLRAANLSLHQGLSILQTKLELMSKNETVQCSSVHTRKMPSSCCVPGCSNKQNYDGYSLFGFPNDQDVKNKWLKAICKGNWEPRTHHRVCEVHFEPSLIHFVGSRKELLKNAVPTLFCNCSTSSELNHIPLVYAAPLSPLSDATSPSSPVISEHSYCFAQNHSIKLEVNDHTDVPAKDLVYSPPVKKTFKHSLTCNILREPLKNSPKSTSKMNTKAIFKLVAVPDPLSLCKISSVIPITANSKETSHVTKMPIIKTEKQLTCNTRKLPDILSEKQVEKTTDEHGDLKIQLQTALKENAKLKKELNSLKQRVVPSTTLVPLTKVKFVVPVMPAEKNKK